ncbi:efflux RND transporter periplasmic adaptor subunit [Desulfuromonas acetoxidans]|uniref:Secretion protein HlyD n=1 Tax=Desulfuromonas acetoxidans (strain DSM 684 / 11070) TaxID=281689 RepID=Q1JVY2_DESA6|nr:efflux RND transporter periplasmic adaptor subunit [Desulfuromonas acetoxidans]EAT14384.1 Secretion protein HlyD [Desulfuromonas acetoxidans DSM 684]NVD23890.1 efflux RND transporter periplasmic adaptor subunit [Desulfuromonas acetoxidans]NVE16187.1 efflux RND transporter periplasmic adaptor subunit [Desulfuromonas acetoxidans]
MKLSNKQAVFLVGTLVVLILIWWAVPQEEGRTQTATPLTHLVSAERRTLEVTVEAAGSLRARDQVVISNTLEGRTTILSLVEEGTNVSKGDKLIELDASTLQDRLIDQQITVQNAEASFVQARENLEVVKNQAQSDVDEAKLAVTYAEDDLKKYREGEFPNEKKEQLSQIAVDEEELRRAEEKLEWSRVLFDEKFISQTELQADELAAQKAGIDLELSRSNLDLLLKFTHVRRLTELNAEVEKTRMALERIQRKAKASVIQAQADLNAKQALLERERGRLSKTRDELNKTVLVAPQDGIVVYATSFQRSWRGNNEPLTAGQEVRERQELIYLPSSGTMVAQTQIHESNLEKVELGQKARVYVDSMPGKSFLAEVKSVAVFPDATSSWLNPDLKLYRTDLELLEHDDALRSGLNCRIEIDVAHLEDVVTIPVQAVVIDGGRTFVYCRKDGRVQQQDIQLGQSNESFVEVIDGLQPGDRVQLNPPVTGTEE